MVDQECICCRRYYSKSCEGVENRGRASITYSNMCSGFLLVCNKTDCNCNQDIFNKIQTIKDEIGIA